MVSVPILVTATDRFDPRQVYLLGVGLTVIGHLLFGLFAMVGAMFGGLFGFHTVHKGISTAQHVENMSNHSGRKRKQKRSSFLP